VVKSLVALWSVSEFRRFECWVVVSFGAKTGKFKKERVERGFRYEATNRREGVVCFSKLCVAGCWQKYPRFMGGPWIKRVIMSGSDEGSSTRLRRGR
jgi:hypothetical protein